MSTTTTTIRLAHATVSTRAAWSGTGSSYTGSSYTGSSYTGSSYTGSAFINKRHIAMNPARGPGGVS